MKIFILLFLSIVCGILGRLGGKAKNGSWYDFLSNTKARDIGCPLTILSTILVLFGFHLNLWWVYLIIIPLHLGAFSTYWDFLFGYDNHWFSGFVVGLTLIPLAFFDIIWYLILIRAILLAIIWGCLNKYLPSKILIWNRDITEEFLRYFSVVITLLLLVIR